MNVFDDLPLQVKAWAYKNLLGQDRWETNWTPVGTGFTNVGTPTLTGRFRLPGRKCEFQVKIVPATTTATVAGTSYIALPVAAAGIAGGGVMENTTTNVAIGTCSFDITNSRVYLPAQAATGNTMTIYGSYEV